LKERCVWRSELETLDQAREVISAYIDHYDDRPHSRLDYRTPREVRTTWDDATGQLQRFRASERKSVDAREPVVGERRRDHPVYDGFRISCRHSPIIP
jgi:hypothetical protein